MHIYDLCNFCHFILIYLKCIIIAIIIVLEATNLHLSTLTSCRLLLSSFRRYVIWCNRVHGFYNTIMETVTARVCTVWASTDNNNNNNNVIIKSALSIKLYQSISEKENKTKRKFMDKINDGRSTYLHSNMSWLDVLHDVDVKSIGIDVWFIAVERRTF